MCLLLGGAHAYDLVVAFASDSYKRANTSSAFRGECGQQAIHCVHTCQLGVQAANNAWTDDKCVVAVLLGGLCMMSSPANMC